MTKDEIKQALAALVEKGLIKDSGRRRNGQIVWVCTEFDDSETDSVGDIDTDHPASTEH